ncbi:digestive cysteine proteinase 2-like [Rhineura floridana]|uniref:digestive cysteine proteinase 2-like n=1 Tax=Rhineura floridana TaxID=261503 RepID=UPI002AC86992|nr:digestive cysteine proteinase 2-like [Rhineura floridana]XP_061452509.1 digestive cysteine proteinase 2-like [Rhineura floridana]
MLPKFGDTYHITGILKLPYAEIEEPFEAWFNETGGKSRIQYYHGQVITYQFGFIKPFGASFKVTPETTETEANIKECFRINGTSENPIRPQSVFPSLHEFQPVRQEYYNGQHCTVLEATSFWGQKKNIYRLWMAHASSEPVPVHYEMKGFNTLLGSHYDKYEIDYTNFSRRFPCDVFDLPDGIKCTHWPGAGPDHRILANPMQEFVGRAGEVSRDHEHLFHHYKEKFRKTYKSEKEMERRKHSFIHNMRYIHSRNRANLSYKLAVNHLADHTTEEMAVLRGRLKTGEPNKGWPFPTQGYNDLTLPESLDWRLYGAVTPVKDQAVCGSCWSFATTGALEGALFLKTGVLTPLSQQVLIDCSWGFGNHACDGGEEWHAYEWIMKHGGIASTESYGPYLGQNGYCHYNQSELIAMVSGYVNVASENTAAVKAALYKHGPVAVNIDASHKSFAFYSNGIYYEPNCGNKSIELDHAVLAIGYGELHGESYWLIKNSWSTYWGNDGYILMSMKNNNCGVATASTYPVLA